MCQAVSFISNCTILTKQQKVEGVHSICNPCFVALQLCEFRYFLELTESYFAQLRRNLMMSIDVDSIPGLGRSPGEGKGYPHQFSGLENSMDCIVHGVINGRTLLSDFHFHIPHIVGLNISCIFSSSSHFLLIGGPKKKKRGGSYCMHIIFAREMCK